MFAVIEFDESCGAGVAVVRNEWLTPRKRECFWPPHKDSSKFQKIIKQGSDITETWQLYSVSRVFYETADYDQAVKKSKIGEVTSNLQWETECTRKGILKRRLYTSTDESENENLL
ncbi:hypothetical protein ILUMI_13910 [Ignelater luminosus]|uniref:Uncharacterized protein n=1 Tax=Ignelater luminosus TaxID=2038154 RepID=A0A8K0CRH1_IGNLU|nr:hypothetical protein ILUMI_13910 [Ignelater luminosus]